MNDNTYELTLVEREHIEGLVSMQKRLEGEIMGALAMLCKQHGLEPSRVLYRNGCLSIPEPPRIPMPEAPRPVPVPASNGG